MTYLIYNNQQIEQRFDGYVNASAMCRIHGKRFSDWTRTADYKRYETHIQKATGLCRADLVRVSGDSFIHPKLAIKLGRWISVDFEFWCDENIQTQIETPEPKPFVDAIEWLDSKVGGKQVQKTEVFSRGFFMLILTYP
jgi:hypothetical protein